MRLYGFWRSLASFRVRIALNLKGIAFDEVAVNLMQGEQRGDAYRAVNSQGVLPALDTGEGEALFQSLAILEYLEETHPAPSLLPADARGRARVRGLALIAVCEAHPLVVPRVREYLEHDLHLDEPTRAAWLRHWTDSASAALEARLAADRDTGRFCHGDSPGMADICAVAHVAGAGLFGCDMTPYPTLRRIVASCLELDAFARAHPLKQPGAPAPVGQGAR
jgi:maleylacetoacetate isomerase